MSLRPRFAGDGVLRRPTSVSFSGGRRPEVDDLAFEGEFGNQTYDPFEHVESGLLLAEDFARVDLHPRREALDWVGTHGTVDLLHFLPPDPNSTAIPERPPYFSDRVADVTQQQQNVAWHLLSLARLSEHLFAGKDWDPSWVQPVIRVGLDLLWLGGTTPRSRHIGFFMREAAEPRGITPPEMTDEGFRDWWQQAHASYQQIIADRVPIVWVPSPAIRFWTWEAQAALDDPLERALTEGVGTDPWSLVELQRRLMAPFIARAGDHRADIGWPADGPRPGVPLMVRERRTWDSLLAPVYVQLLEGLRRITEGQRGAAFCKECGQPFLTLDARRSTFCTDRERARFGQRAHRKRVSAQDSMTITDVATVHIDRGGSTR